MTWKEISSKYNKNDLIKSLNNGNVIKYSGFLTVCGNIGKDSFNDDLILYFKGKCAKVIEKGIDEEAIHIQNVINKCNRLNCSPTELLQKDYITELAKL